MVHLLELSPENTFPSTSSLKNIILFGAPGGKASTMVIWITQLSSGTEYLSMYAIYLLCMVENANYPSNSRVVVGHRFPFVQVVIIHGIYFGLSIFVMLLFKYDIII